MSVERFLPRRRVVTEARPALPKIGATFKVRDFGVGDDGEKFDVTKTYVVDAVNMEKDWVQVVTAPGERGDELLELSPISKLIRTKKLKKRSPKLWLLTQQWGPDGLIE